jgi:hypothetical protein
MIRPPGSFCYHRRMHRAAMITTFTHESTG